MKMEQTSINNSFNGLKAMVLGKDTDNKELQSLCDFISMRLLYITDTMAYLDEFYKERYFKNNEYKGYKRQDYGTT